MSNEVTKQASKEVTTGMTLADWGSNTQMSAKDLVIPKILPQQPASQYVLEGKAAFGDFCHSLTGDILGSITKPIKFTPIYMDKVWLISKKIDGDFKFSKIEAVNPDNENWSWSDVEEGVEIKREYVRNFYVLIDGVDMPFVLSFKGTSTKSGQVLATQMYTLNAMQKLSPASTTMELTGRIEKNDKGSFVVIEVKPVGKTPDDRIMKAFEWLQAIEAGIAKTDNSDVEKAGPVQHDMFDKESKF